MSGLENKVAVITGSSTPKGIGSAIARRLARAGAAVYLVAEGTREQLEAVCSECRGYAACVRAEYALFELSERGAAEAMIAERSRRPGGPMIKNVYGSYHLASKQTFR